MSTSRAWPKLLSIWMNAAAEAWNMGEAKWLYHEGRSFLVRVWCMEFERTGDEMLATEWVREQAESKGIDPKRHRAGRVG